MVSGMFIAQSAGMIASISFFIQYLPQAWLNYQRKSVKGFSTSSIIIKLIGAAYLFINAMWSGEAVPVVCYGLFNMLQHSIFMVQFYLYSGADESTKGEYSNGTGPAPTLPPGHPHHKPVGSYVTKTAAAAASFLPLRWVNQFASSRAHYLLWILFPLVPLFMAVMWPATIAYTNSIKPLGQVLSHIPQVIECLRLRTTLGISMSSQHLNFLGGAMGLLMCLVIPPIYTTTYIIYLNSVFQATSIYAIAWYYREPLFPSFGKEAPALPPL